MKESVKKIKQRKKWIDHYEQCQSVSLTCRKFDIPRSTFYHWYKRYQESGSDGLADLSRKPHNLAKTKVTKEHEQIILTLRSMYKWGPQRIATFLQREHGLSFAKSTIWRILQKHAVEPVKKYRRNK
ncbi:helix-turn-helix domain containing protein, partial [Desulfohalobiaceae bacterium Ax17]|uniref:helix-turn-helix domain-containing protein n=1 Tax=Desulfovulcanus ferrireducens TaxID=2831190 RepID=UPI00207BA194